MTDSVTSVNVYVKLQKIVSFLACLFFFFSFLHKDPLLPCVILERTVPFKAENAALNKNPSSFLKAAKRNI